MTEVIVVHKWKDEQKDQVMKFATTIMDMAKSKKLLAGLKLEELFLADKENQAVCRWDMEEKYTEPPKRYDVASLLKLMESVVLNGGGLYTSFFSFLYDFAISIMVVANFITRLYKF